MGWVCIAHVHGTPCRYSRPQSKAASARATPRPACPALLVDDELEALSETNARSTFVYGRGSSSISNPFSSSMPPSIQNEQGEVGPGRTYPGDKIAQSEPTDANRSASSP